MNKKSLFVLMSVVVILAMLLSGCGGNAPAENPAPAAPAADAAPVSAIQQIKNNGVIRIAVPEDTPLFGAVGTDGQLTGYDVDVANMVAKDLGVKVELVPVSSANRIPYLTSGNVDLMISSMGVKP